MPLSIHKNTMIFCSLYFLYEAELGDFDECNSMMRNGAYGYCTMTSYP